MGFHCDFNLLLCRLRVTRCAEFLLKMIKRKEIWQSRWNFRKLSVLRMKERTRSGVIYVLMPGLIPYTLGTIFITQCLKSSNKTRIKTSSSTDCSFDIPAINFLSISLNYAITRTKIRISAESRYLLNWLSWDGPIRIISTRAIKSLPIFTFAACAHAES